MLAYQDLFEYSVRVRTPVGERYGPPYSRGGAGSREPIYGWKDEVRNKLSLYTTILEDTDQEMDSPNRRVRRSFGGTSVDVSSNERFWIAYDNSFGLYYDVDPAFGQ